MSEQGIRQKLQSLSRDELNIVARKFRIKGYRRMRQSEVIESILGSVEPAAVREVLDISWWSKHYKHVYGLATLAALLLTVLFYLYPRLPIRNAASKVYTSNGDREISIAQAQDDTADNKLVRSSKQVPNLVVNDMGIEETRSQKYKYFRFMLSNQGGGTLFIKKMWLEVIDIKPCNKIKIWAWGAPLTVFTYKVELDPTNRCYVLCDNQFSLDRRSFAYASDGEPDGFLVALTSEDSMIYRFRLNITWLDISTGQEQTTSAMEHTIEFPISDPGQAAEYVKQLRKQKTRQKP